MPISILRKLTYSMSIAASLSCVQVNAVQADGLTGAYLAARAATFDRNFAKSAEYYLRALVRDGQNPVLLENVVFAEMALGNLEGALPVAQRMFETGQRSQVGAIVMAGHYTQVENYDAILERDLETQGVSPLVDGLLNAWAYMGQGAVSKALAQFDEVAKQDGLRFFAQYHKALALASVGDYQAAADLFSENGGQLARSSRRAAIANVQILSQLGRNADAFSSLQLAFGRGFDPSLHALAERLKADETLPFTIAKNATDGIAEVFFVLAAALKDEAADDYVLMYSRMTTALRPDHVDSILLSASLLDQIGQYNLAIETYALVPKDEPDFHAAELGRAEALRRAAKPDAAIEVLQQLSQDFSNSVAAFMDLGDLLRQEKDYSGAVAAYDRALALTDPQTSNRWFLLYARGIGHERLKMWDKAEADFRAALDIDPDQPQVLNYLGYSLVERQENLDEALGMIERAVAARPDSGYIVDSLGWVLYRLGRYEEAVPYMERAVELMSIDPVVNDHLGDVYWAVGRHLEAEFQWKRALSFIKPDETNPEANPERIRRKLDVGLDVVLKDEGADPLQVADGG